MTVSPAPDTPDAPSPQPPRRRWLGWLVFGLVGAGAGWIGFWVLLQQVAQPFIERQVSNTLERPVEMGRVTHVSLNRIHFGPTSLLTQPDDVDHGQAQAVEVQFTPLKIVLQRRLELDITLKDSAAYVEEDKNGNWLKIPDFPEGNLPIKIRVTAIRIQQAALDVVKRDAKLQLKAPLQLQVERGALLINGGADDMEIEQLEGEFLQGGNFTIDGDISMAQGLDSLKGKIAARLQTINLAEVARILPPLPLEVRQGQVSANTVITLAGNPIKLDTAPELTGVARVQGVEVATPFVEPTVTVNYGNIRLQGKVAQLDGWRTRLGDNIPVNIGGSISAADVDANQVLVNLEPTAVNTLLKTFEFEKLLPVPVTGAIALEAALAGPLDRPVVVGRVTNGCPEPPEPQKTNAQRPRTQPKPHNCELRVDRLPIKGLRVDFQADVLEQRLQVERVQIQPRAGGAIVAKGIASLKGEKPVGILNAVFADLPANALLATYGAPLPLQVGTIAGRARAVVPLKDWQALQAVVNAQVLGGTVDIGNIELKEKQWAGTVIAQNLRLPAPLPADRATARLRIAGRLDRFSLDTITVNGQASATLAQGQVVVPRLALAQNQFSAVVDAQNAGVKAIAAPFLPAQLAALPIGNLNGRLAISGRLRGAQLPDLVGQGAMTLGLAGGAATVQGLRLQNNQLTANARAQNIALAPVARLVPTELPLSTLELGVANATIALQTNLAPLLKGNVNALLGQTTVQLNAAIANFGGGQATAQANLQGTQLTAQAQTQGLALAPFVHLLPAKLPINTQALGTAQAAVNLNTNLAPLLQGNSTALLGQTNLSVNAAIADLSGGQATAQANLQGGQWQAAVAGQNLNPTRLLPQLPQTLAQAVAGQFVLQGTVPQRFDLNSLTAQGSGAVQLGAGRVALPALALKQGRLVARAQPENLALRPFHPLLRGQLKGDVTATVPLQNVTALTAAGTVNLNRGVSLVTKPLDIAFNWGNERLTLDRLQADQQLDVKGFVDVNLAQILRGAIGPDVITQVNLDVNAPYLPLQQGIQELQQFIAPLPEAATQVALHGGVGFKGKIQGNLRSPQVSGNASLNQIALNCPNYAIDPCWRLDPLIAGPVSLDRSGATVDLQGDRDRIQLGLDGGYLPTGFEVQLRDLRAIGRREGPLLKTAVANVPLQEFKGLIPPGLLPPLVAAQPLAGDFSGQVDVNLNNWGVAGSVAIAALRLGPLQAEQFTGDVQYTDGAIALKDAELRTGETRYLFSGRAIPFGPDPQVQAEAEIVNGNLKDMLAALELAKLSDVLQLTRTVSSPATGTAADLETVGVGVRQTQVALPPQPERNTTEPGSQEIDLNRLSEILALLDQRQQDSINALPLPPLKFVQGEITGKLAIGGSLKNGFDGLQGEVNLAGKDWQWGNYIADRVTIKGNLNEGVVTIQPLELQTGQGSILLSGVFGVDNINGQVQISDFPIITLQDLIPLPPAIGFGGEINATATLAGDRANPRMQGQLNITGANINDTPINTATARFNYNQSVLRFGARSTLSESGTPLTLTGRIPYQIPIPGTTAPPDHNIEMEAKVQNDGLAILNIITRQQLIWQGGDAAVDVKLAGQLDPETQRLAALTADGEVRIANGIVGSALLPEEPLTNLNTYIHLDFDQIKVEELTGQFGGGAIAIAGNLPTFQRSPQANPLTVQMQQLTVALKGVLEGTIDGQVQVLGTALSPEITGDVGVSNGEVQLLGVAGLTNKVAAAGGDGGGGGGLTSLIELRDLNITLTNDFILRQFPILEFAVQGGLTVNGTLPNLEPQGEIDLTRGYLNLFTTNFRLDGDYRSQALLSPITGLDPFLDMRLIGSVIESERRAFAVESANAEVADRPTNVGSLQSLQVIAEVQASAFQLIETLRNSQRQGLSANNRLINLSSSPRRSETEILALMGGSFVNSVAGGDNTALLGGFANIAGNALFGDIQRTVSDTFGLSEFRVFPAQVIDTSEDADSSNGTLGVAVELSKTVADRASISLFQFLTPSNQPPRFNIRYRIDENFTIRGSTDLDGDNRAVLEYELRF